MAQNQKKRAHEHGFSLVEIIVVVSIISILAAVVLISVGTVRDKGEDEARISDLQQLELALKVYRSTNGAYPDTGGEWYGLCENCDESYQELSGPNGYIPDLAPKYINKLPVDPHDNRTGWSGYLYRSDGINYKLLSHEDGPENFESKSSYLDPARDGGDGPDDDPTACSLDGTDYSAWQISSDGARCW